MSDFEVKVTGLKEAQKALYSYSQQLGDRVVIKSLQTGANLMKKQAQANAPVRTGNLQRGLIVKRSKLYNGRRRPDVLGVFLTLRKGKRYGEKDAFYGKFQEAGWTDRAGIRHAGRQFLGRAFSSTAQRAGNLIVQTAKAGAELIARKTGLK